MKTNHFLKTALFAVMMLTALCSHAKYYAGTITLKVGETYYANANFGGGYVQTGSWSKSNSTFIFVSQGNKSCTIRGNQAGTGTLSYTGMAGAYDASCYWTVNVVANEPTSISVSPSSKTIRVGETFTPTFSITPSNATTTVTWSSDNSGIASVNSSTGKVTGVKAGSTYINATTSNGKTAWCKVTVEKVEGIEIDATNFPDAKFRNYLLEQSYGKDGIITEEEIKGITSISVGEKNISSLKGIEYFTALTSLDCRKNELTSLDVSNNTALTSLSCYSNELTSLDVSNNTALTTLSCYSNELTSLDVSNNTALTRLYCYSNQLASLDVSKNTALTDLYCYSNELTSLDVSKNTALTTLWCSSNELTSLDVSKNTALTYLYCSSNELTSLDVSKNTALTYLSCGSNQLTTLDVSKNTALTSLSCENNQLTSLDVSKNTALTYLSCGSKKLTSLDVSKNTALTELFCNYSQLIALDVSNNTALTTLYCSSNELTSLDVSNNTALTDLSCYSNQLASLDVSKNTALTYLYCYSNLLTTLDVSKNTALTRLYCYSNQLASLDVSKNTALTYLNCSSNQLASLDVSKNTALTYLNCGGNELTSLDVSKNTALTSLFIYRNNIKEDTMDDFISRLPQNTTDLACSLGIYRNTEGDEGNVCTKSQVAAIKAKGWTPKYYNGSAWVEYEGMDTPPISISLPVMETVYVNGTLQLTPTIEPDYAVTDLSWSSDDTSIAKVTATGMVVGIKEGTVIITVRTSNGLVAECIVVVKEENVGIGDIEADGNGDVPIYNLAGQRVESLQGKKGIFIIGGKKVMVK